MWILAMLNISLCLLRIIHLYGFIQTIKQNQSSSRSLENFCEDIPTSPVVMKTNTLNFRPNFKCSRSRVIFVGTPSPFKCALSRLVYL